MPQITGILTDEDTRILTDYTGNATDVLQTFYFKDKQNGMILTNNGSTTLTVNASGNAYSVLAGASVLIDRNFSSFSIMRNTKGTDTFTITAYAFKNGNGEIPSLPNGVKDQLNEITDELATKAKQSDVDAINTQLLSKVNQSDLNTTNANVAANTAQLADIATTPEMFGAIGNGVVDDTTAFENMLNSTGNRIRLGKNKIYKTTRKLKIAKSFTEIDLNGSTIIFDSTTVSTTSTDNKLFYVAPSAIDVNAKRANVTSIGVYYKFGNMPEKIMGKFIVDDVSKFTVGDCVVIEYQTAATNTHTLADLKPSVGTYAKILEIDTINKIVYTDYYTELDLRGLPPISGSGFMYVIDPVKKVKIKNGILKSITPNSAGKSDCAIRAEYTDGIIIENITVIDFNEMAIQPRWARNVTVRNIESDIQRGDKSLSYVIQCLNLYNGIFENITGTTNLAILDFSYGCAYIHVRNVHSRNALGAWGAIQLHGECEHDIMFENCSGYFSFANDTGEFAGYSYNITLENCKGAAYLTGCDGLQINNSNLILTSTEYDGLRMYGVSVNDSRIQLTKDVFYTGSTRGSLLSPYIRFSNTEITPFYNGTGLYKFKFKQFDDVSFVNNCRVKNTKANIGSYFVLDTVTNFDFKNSKLDGFVFSIRNNDGGTASTFTFNRYVFDGSEIRITDINCATKASTTSLDWFMTFNNVVDLFGEIIIKNCKLSFGKDVAARKWSLINLSSITATSNVKIRWYRDEITSDVDLDLDEFIPHATGYRVYYDHNIIDPSNVNEIGVYKLSNYYTAIPSSGVWDIRKRIMNKTPAVGSPKSWICTVSGNPGTWVSEGNL